MTTHEATELKLYIDNEQPLYNQKTSILKNLATKKARGIYKHDLAVKGFGYLVEAGAKKYAKEFDSPANWHKIFPVPTRKAVAEALTRDFEGEYDLGNYDYLLPKKYQKASPTVHATKKSAKWKTPEGLAVRWAPTNNAWFVLWPTSAAINKQQVLKIGPTEEIHGWLRDTYGPAYGLVGRTSSGHARKKSSAQLQREINSALSAHRRRR